MYNSQEFFREVEMGMQMRETRGPGQVLIRREDMNVKVGLKSMVHKYGDEEAKERYEKDKHSALTDAWLIERMVNSEKFRDQWADWLDSRISGL